MKEIFRKKDHSYLREKVNLLEVTDDALLLKISFLLEYKNRMISIVEKEPIAVPFKEFKFDDWGDGVRKIAGITRGLNALGALRIEQKGGRLEEVYSGDVMSWE